jgi:hypothetical protein
MLTQPEAIAMMYTQSDNAMPQMDSAVAAIGGAAKTCPAVKWRAVDSTADISLLLG